VLTVARNPLIRHALMVCSRSRSYFRSRSGSWSPLTVLTVAAKLLICFCSRCAHGCSANPPIPPYARARARGLRHEGSPSRRREGGADIEASGGKAAALSRASRSAEKTDPIYLSPEYRQWRELVIQRAGRRCEWVEGGRRCLKAEPEHRLVADRRIERWRRAL
jgi:hypothetical protein